jgi:hypothetical protein
MLTLAFLAALPLALDRYQRVSLGERRDGPLVLGLSRETLRTARRLEQGREIAFDAARQRFAWGRSEPADLRYMRWFLRDGWGDGAHYGIGDIVLREAQATLLLPCLRPQPLEVALVLEAPREVRLAAYLNGEAVGEVGAGADAVESVLHLPAEPLFRGDNLLKLAVKGPYDAHVRLRRLTYRPAPGP